MYNILKDLLFFKENSRRLYNEKILYYEGREKGY